MIALVFILSVLVVPTIDKREGRVIYDIAYLKNWSLWLDFIIIFKTLKLVVKDSQAY